MWKFRSDSSKVNRAKYADASGRISFAMLSTEPFYDDWSVRMAKIFSMGVFLSSPAVADGMVYV